MVLSLEDVIVRRVRDAERGRAVRRNDQTPRRAEVAESDLRAILPAKKSEDSCSAARGRMNEFVFLHRGGQRPTSAEEGQQVMQR